MLRKIFRGIAFVLLLFWGVFVPAQTLADGLSLKSAEARGSVRIVGGDVVRDPNAYPWAISLAASGIADLYDAHSCGATLISPTWALSAAHCFVDDETGVVDDEFDVVLGTLSLRSPSPGYERIPVERLIIHPEYDLATTDNDIALLKLERASTRQPVAWLAAREQDAAPGLMATVMGWGWTAPEPRAARSFPTELLKLDLPVVDNDVCARSMIFEESVVTQNMLCAGTGLGGQDSCSGDSGGPLVRTLAGGGHMLVGVVSWGEGCAQPDSYGVYARVSRFADWINSHIDGGLTADQWITSFYVAYWGRAGDPGGLEYWLGEVNRGALTIPAVAENFALSAEAKAMYPYFNAPEAATDAERAVFVQAAYQNLLNRSVTADDEGVVYWVGELRNGNTTPGAVIGNMIHAAIQNGDQDWLTIWNKVQVAEYFTQRFEASGRAWQDGDLDLARQALVGVTDDPDTVDAAKARVEQLLHGGSGGGSESVQTYTEPAVTINVKVNHEFVIALESNPTTGYTWEEESEEDLIRLVDRIYRQDDQANGMVGVGGTVYFRYLALQEGETEILLVYGQHWDGGARNAPVVFNVAAYL